MAVEIPSPTTVDGIAEVATVAPMWLQSDQVEVSAEVASGKNWSTADVAEEGKIAVATKSSADEITGSTNSGDVCGAPAVHRLKLNSKTCAVCHCHPRADLNIPKLP